MFYLAVSNFIQSSYFLILQDVPKANKKIQDYISISTESVVYTVKSTKYLLRFQMCTTDNNLERQPNGLHTP